MSSRYAYSHNHNRVKIIDLKKKCIHLPNVIIYPVVSLGIALCVPIQQLRIRSLCLVNQSWQSECIFHVEAFQLCTITGNHNGCVCVRTL